MADSIKPRVKLPSTAVAGETIVIKTLVAHQMESGQRLDDAGNIIPRHIIHRFTCHFNGEPVIDIDMRPAISTNPYFEFEMTVPESGRFEFAWYDDDGDIYTKSHDISVA